MAIPSEPPRLGFHAPVHLLLSLLKAKLRIPLPILRVPVVCRVWVSIASGSEVGKQEHGVVLHSLDHTLCVRWFQCFSWVHLLKGVHLPFLQILGVCFIFTICSKDKSLTVMLKKKQYIFTLFIEQLHIILTSYFQTLNFNLMFSP